MLCDAQQPTPGALLKSFFPILQRLERAIRHTSIGFESIQKQSSPPSISETILSRIALHREEVILRLSLYCRREIRLGISTLYSCSFANNSDSLSIPTASDAMFKATTSRSENLGTNPRLGTFPDSLTKLPAICLHMFSNFANIAYKLCIRYLSIKSLFTFNLLNINNMHNFLNINLL